MTGGDGPLRAIDKLNMARGKFTRKLSRNLKYQKKRKSVKKTSGIFRWYKSVQRYTYRKK